MTENTPLVSVITPSLNQGGYLEETIASVISQDYPHIEHLVIDGGSEDGTLDILRKYDEHIEWLSEPDRGQSHAINKGLERAQGSIIGWLNSDDLYTQSAVAKAVEFLQSNPEYAMVYGNADIINEFGQKIESYRTEPFDLGRLAKHCPISQPAAFIRTDIFRDIGGVDEELHFCMDMDLWVRIGQTHKIGFIHDVLAESRWHASNKTFGRRKDALLEAMRVTQRHYGHVPKARIRAYVEHSLDDMFGDRLRTDGIIFKNMRKLSTRLNFIKYNYSQRQFFPPGSKQTNETHPPGE
jgi:glycosyltransferase involved in cell wall biosynthesis